MTITQRLMKPGRFHVELGDNYPESIATAVALLDHIVITPTAIDTDAITDASILSMAVYTGVVTAKPSLRIFEGADLSFWLATDQGLGDILDAAVAATANTLSQWITLLCPASLTVGTVNNTGTSTLTNSFQWITRREAIDAVCRSTGAEWRVNPNGTIDAATKANLFATPNGTTGVVVTRKAEGLDGGQYGLDASLLVPGSDVEQYTTAVYALGQGDGPAVVNSVATLASPFKDLKNGTVVMERIVSSPSDPAAALPNVAAAVLGQFGAVRREISLSSDTYTVTRFVKPGDEVWVYDVRAGLTDATQQIEWRGELIAPIKQRVLALTWSLERGCGVYLRKSGATPTYIDLTPYIAWENGDVQWEIGAASRVAIGDGGTAGTAYLPTTAAVADRVATAAPSVILTDAAQTTTTGVAADITWGTEISDPDSWHAAGSTDVVVPTGKGGRYLVTFSGTWSAPFAGGAVFARVNSVAFQAAPIEAVVGIHTLTFLATLTAGDILQFRVFQASGANKDVTSRLEIAPA